MILGLELKDDFDEVIANLKTGDEPTKCQLGITALELPHLVKFISLLEKGGLLRVWVKLFAQEHYHTRDNIECPYHRESLLEHSLRAALLTMLAAQNAGSTGDEVLEAGVTGFLHDAGKVYAAKTIPNRSIVAYPCHDNYGAIAVASWAYSLTERPIWMDNECIERMCVVINCHMCGTHTGINHSDILLKLALPILSNIQHSQKWLLSFLRVGDTLGAIANDDYQSGLTVSQMLGATDDFYNTISPSTHQRIPNKKGTFVALLGFPANGKTSVGNIITQTYNNCVLCSRDTIIAAISTVVGVSFHTIKSRIPSVLQANGVLTHLGMEFSIQSHIPTKNGKPMNWNSFADWVCQEWGNLTLSQNKIFILDTVGPIQGNFNCYPEKARDALRFNILCKSIVPLTEEERNAPHRAGLPNLDEVARSGTLANPLSTPASWDEKQQLRSLDQRKMVFAGTSEDDVMRKDKSLTNPHYTGYAIWDGVETHGLRHTMEMMGLLFDY